MTAPAPPTTPAAQDEAAKVRSNSAVRRGRGDALLAAFVGLVLTTVSGFLWLHYADAGAETFDLLPRLDAFGTLLGDTEKRAIPLLAAYAAVAIALAVALSSALAQLGKIDELRPAEGTDDEEEWIRRRSALLVLVLAEMIVTVAATGWAAASAGWFIRHGDAMIAMLAILLACFLLVETVRCLTVIRMRPPEGVVPLPGDIAARLNRLARPRPARAVYAGCWWAGWLACSVVAGVVFEAAAGQGAALYGIVTMQAAFLFGLLVARLFASSAVTENVGARTFTLIGSITYALVLPITVYPTVLLTLLTPSAREDLLWWGLGALALMLTLLVFRVLDEAGVTTSWSAALRRHRHWTSLPRVNGTIEGGTDAHGTGAEPAPTRPWGRSVWVLLAVAVASVAVFGAMSAQGARLTALALALLAFTALSRWTRAPGWVTAPAALVAALIAARTPEVDGPLLGTWAGYTAIVLIAVHRATRTGDLLTAAPDTWLAWINRRRAKRWADRLASIGVAQRTRGGIDVYTVTRPPDTATA